MQLAEMVRFRDYTSSSFKNKYLLIEVDDCTILTRLLTDTPIVAMYADPWPPLHNSLHMSDGLQNMTLVLIDLLKHSFFGLPTKVN